MCLLAASDIMSVLMVVYSASSAISDAAISTWNCEIECRIEMFYWLCFNDNCDRLNRENLLWYPVSGLSQQIQLRSIYFVNKCNCRHIFSHSLSFLFEFRRPKSAFFAILLIQFLVKRNATFLTNWIQHLTCNWNESLIISREQSKRSAWVIYGILNDISLSFLFQSFHVRHFDLQFDLNSDALKMK